MNPHDASHEDVLRDILAGDLADAAPAARAVLDGCADCRDRLAELRAIAAELDAAGERARSVIAEAERAGDAPGLEHVARVIGTAPLGGARARSMPLWAAALLLIAVAGIIAAAAWAMRGRGGDRHDTILSGIEIEAIAPKGASERFGEFRWRAERPAGGWFVVRVRAPGAAPEDPPLAQSGEIEEPRWAPDDEASLPREIEWEVRLYDSGRNPLGASGWIRAERRAP